MAHDFVSDLENNKSHSGCLVFLHDTPITWIICKETCVIVNPQLK